MTPRLASFLLAVVLLAPGIGSVGATVVAGPEPAVEGRLLSAWLGDLDPGAAEDDRAPAVAALRTLGTNAIPFLLGRLKAEPDDFWRIGEALRHLGPLAAPAIPGLVELVSLEHTARVAATILGGLDESARTPEAVRALADLSLQQDVWQARAAVDTLGSWGRAASNAVSQLLRGLRAQTQAGGESGGANKPRSPRFTWALAEIDRGSPEVLHELLAARPPESSRRAIKRWQEGSTNSGELLREAALTASLTVTQRLHAIYGLSARADTNLQALVPDIFATPALRLPMLYSLRRDAPRPAAPTLSALITAAARLDAEDPKFSQEALMTIVFNPSGHWPARELLPQLARLTFDERYLFNPS